jgi:hypothetical protein
MALNCRMSEEPLGAQPGFTRPEDGLGAVATYSLLRIVDT